MTSKQCTEAKCINIFYIKSLHFIQDRFVCIVYCGRFCNLSLPNLNTTGPFAHSSAAVTG